MNEMNSKEQKERVNGKLLEIANTVYNARRRSGDTITEISLLAGYTQGDDVYRLEKNADVTVETLIRVLDVLGLELRIETDH